MDIENIVKDNMDKVSDTIDSTIDNLTDIDRTKEDNNSNVAAILLYTSWCNKHKVFALIEDDDKYILVSCNFRDTLKCEIFVYVSKDAINTDLLIPGGIAKANIIKNEYRYLLDMLSDIEETVGEVNQGELMSYIAQVQDGAGHNITTRVFHLVPLKLFNTNNNVPVYYIAPYLVLKDYHLQEDSKSYKSSPSYHTAMSFAKSYYGNICVLNDAYLDDLKDDNKRNKICSSIKTAEFIMECKRPMLSLEEEGE